MKNVDIIILFQTLFLDDFIYQPVGCMDLRTAGYCQIIVGLEVIDFFRLCVV